MLRLLQLLFLALFAVFAAATIVLQIRYGMLTGRSEQSNPQEDPAAIICHKRATFCAVLAGVMLVCCMAIGAIARMIG